jgi:hypothetical protein
MDTNIRTYIHEIVCAAHLCAFHWSKKNSLGTACSGATNLCGRTGRRRSARTGAALGPRVYMSTRAGGPLKGAMEVMVMGTYSSRTAR